MIGPGGVRYPITPDIERFLRSMDRDALQSLVLEMAGYSPEAMRSLQLRATPEDEPTASELLVTVDGALAGVDLDYHDPFYEDVDDGIQTVEEAVDELERHLDDGAHPVVRRVLQHLLTRLGDLARDADNADALLGEAERASTLFGRAVAGHPDPVSLAGWVVGFRVEYGGWPSLALETPWPTPSTSPPGTPTARVSRPWAAADRQQTPTATRPTACCWNWPTTTATSNGPSPCCQEVTTRTTGRSSADCVTPDDRLRSSRGWTEQHRGLRGRRLAGAPSAVSSKDAAIRRLRAATNTKVSSRYVTSAGRPCGSASLRKSSK